MSSSWSSVRGAGDVVVPDGSSPHARRAVARAGSVLAVVVLLEVVVFHEYFSGRSIPPWDFLSHYNTEAFAWWRDGSFLDPAHWMPYAWGGYPAALNLQNSSWYLPVGLAAAVTDFDLHASAVLSALHVGAGAIGMYVLGRRWAFPHAAALLGLVVWFFASGFYAHASHLDIMRGYAWLPWVLACLSPSWPWKRWWGPPVAVLLLWQAFLGMYPGAVVACVYALGAWVLLTQVVLRVPLRDHLLPLAAAVCLAAAMTSIRFLPFALTRGLGTPSEGDGSVFTGGILGTLFYPYGAAELPNDITMRSYFLPVVALVLAGMVAWRAPVVRVAAGAAAVAVVLSVPALPWAGWVDHLPGMSLSRFRMDDFRVVILAATCVLAMAGAARLLEAVPDGRAGARTRTLTPRQGLYLLALVVGAALLGVRGPFTLVEWLSQWALLVAAAVLVVVAARASGRTPRIALAGVTVVALCSGLLGVAATSVPWRGDRAGMEQAFGASVAELVAARSTGDAPQRPARLSPGPGITESTEFESRWARGFYSGELSVVAYVNLKGTPTYELMREQLLDPATAPAASAFWAAPGIGVVAPDDGLPSPDAVSACAARQVCGPGVTVSPRSYRPGGWFQYDVVVPEPGATLAFNEAFYRGWTAEICRDGGGCTTAPVTAGPSGEVRLDVPGGRSVVSLEYRLPGLRTAWVAFGAAVGVLVLWVVAAWLHRSRRQAASSGAPGAGVRREPRERTAVRVAPGAAVPDAGARP